MRSRSTDPTSEQASGPHAGSPVTGADVFWILLMAFLVVIVANGMLVYIATDSSSSLRELLESLC